jgi:hypothetical protein
MIMSINIVDLPAFGQGWEVARSHNFELTGTAFVRRDDWLVSPIMLCHVVKIAQTEGKPRV